MGVSRQLDAAPKFRLARHPGGNTEVIPYIRKRWPRMLGEPVLQGSIGKQIVRKAQRNRARLVETAKLFGGSPARRDCRRCAPVRGPMIGRPPFLLTQTRATPPGLLESGCPYRNASFGTGSWITPGALPLLITASRIPAFILLRAAASRPADCFVSPSARAMLSAPTSSATRDCDNAATSLDPERRSRSAIVRVIV